MSNVVIKVENLGKQYRLGQVGTGTVSHDLNRWWAKMRGKEDPYLKIGEVNDRSVKGESDLVWVLRDINFEVKQGEVLGIIGKNGAGKSTLLKILSRVTAPTTGSIKAKGRIASLLEVGTGFNPELTGKENIFLNGAILGMSKQEIKNKFDEIVDFSGVERYIGTPVKRYSSGMYVRLAFAVAAHLDPEILIVDEVLAVGDAEFQKKCLGKMKDVSGQGRTVLFVSHNMPAIRSLCTRCLLLQNGKNIFDGPTDKAIVQYLNNAVENTGNSSAISIDIPDNLSLVKKGQAKFKKTYLLDSNDELTNILFFRDKLKVQMEVDVYQKIEQVNFSVGILSRYGETIAFSVSKDEFYSSCDLEKGQYKIGLNLDTLLMPGSYALRLAMAFSNTGSAIDNIEYFYPFEVLKETRSGNFEYPWATVHGYVEASSDWNIEQK